MLNGIANLINRMLGRYTIDGTYMGKDIYNIYLDTAKKLYEATKNDSLDDIFEQWIKEQDALHNSKTLAQLLNASDLQNYTEGYTLQHIRYDAKVTNMQQPNDTRKLTGENWEEIEMEIIVIAIISFSLGYGLGEISGVKRGMKMLAKLPLISEIRKTKQNERPESEMAQVFSQNSQT